MIKTKPIFSTYILAGGKSSRMGQDKGLMKFGNHYMVEKVMEPFKDLSEQIIIVTNNQAYSDFKVPVIPDHFFDIGPAGGIHAALNHSQTELNFIVSCDMPFISKSAIEFMLNKIEKHEICIAKSEFIQPLFGIYSKKCLPKWQKQIEQNRYALKDLISHFDTSIINVKNIIQFEENTFVNINTPEDYEFWLNFH